MRVELHGHTVAQARATAQRLLEATAPQRRAKIPAFALALEKQRLRHKVAGARKARVAILDMLAGLRARIRAALPLREAVRPHETPQQKLEREYRAIQRAIMDEAAGVPIDLLAKTLEPILQEMIDAGKLSAREELRLGFDVKNTQAMDALYRMQMQFSKVFVDRETTALKDILARALDEGLSGRETAQLISDRFADGVHYVDAEGKIERTMVDDAWAEMVARTETSRALNLGVYSTYVEQGISFVRWISAEDELTCFPETTNVLDGRGEWQPIRDVTSVTTPRGIERVVGRLKRKYLGDWVILETSVGAVLSTSDHPFWASGAWCEARHLQVGDLLQTATNEFVKIKRLAYLAVGYTHDGNSVRPHGNVAVAVAGESSNASMLGTQWYGERLPAFASDISDVLNDPHDRASRWAMNCHATVRTVNAGTLDAARLSFSDTRHDAILRQLGVDIPSVINLTIEPSEVFFANGVLVHNCPECEALDGEIAPVGQPFSSGDDMPPIHAYCAPPGTTIHTSNGPLAIECILVGDRVLTHQGRYRNVTALSMREIVDDLVTIRVGTSVLQLTDNHPVYDGTSWPLAGSLVPGDNVCSVQRGVVACDDVTRSHYAGPVYNFAVAEDESYVANGIVVHNCRCTTVADWSFLDDPEVADIVPAEGESP